jgi:hypothetical protein
MANAEANKLIEAKKRRRLIVRFLLNVDALSQRAGGVRRLLPHARRLHVSARLQPREVTSTKFAAGVSGV